MDAHLAFIKKYENERFYSLYPVTIVLLMIASFGIFGNSNIVWASCRKPSLRSRSNVLIASAALADVFTQLSHFTLAYNLFFGQTFIALETCYWLQVVPLFFMNFGAFIVLVIGFDRLLSILFPWAYKRSDSVVYMIFMLAFPTMFGLFMISVGYSGLRGHRQEKTFCLIAAAFHSSVTNTWIHCTLLTNILIIITYTLMWITVKIKKGKYDKKILNSLTVIMIFVLFGWFISSLLFSIVIELGFDEEYILKSMMYIGTAFINPALASNYLVYMCFCKQYRLAFIEQWQILTCRRRSNNSFSHRYAINAVSTANQTTSSANCVQT